MSRFLKLSATASRMAAGGLREVSSRLVGGGEHQQHPLLTAKNAKLLAQRLAHLRGAAMKLGQMLSLEGDNLLPKRFAEALSILRDAADTMPEAQVRHVLEQNYGAGWQARFKTFDFKPIASASIGQVHRARAEDGRDIALKIQYPGVADSIDSDVDNLHALLRVARLIPAGIDVSALFLEAKKQLHEEVDYQRELSKLTEYGELVRQDANLVVPIGYADLTTSSILGMQYVKSSPLSVRAKTMTETQRDAVGAQLIDLVLRELLQFNLVQTDPNYSNFGWQEETSSLVLFDFGATRNLGPTYQQAYRSILQALLAGDFPSLRNALTLAGFLHQDTPDDVKDMLTHTALMASEVFAGPRPYDFGASDLTLRFQLDPESATRVRKEARPPPAPLLFFQRKLVGTFLICRDLKARVNCREAIIHRLSLTS